MAERLLALTRSDPQAAGSLVAEERTDLGVLDAHVDIAARDCRCGRGRVDRSRLLICSTVRFDARRHEDHTQSGQTR
jgi:hypothetical protein